MQPSIPNQQQKQNEDSLDSGISLSFSTYLLFFALMAVFVFHGFLLIEIAPNFLKTANKTPFFQWGWMSWLLFSLVTTFILSACRLEKWEKKSSFPFSVVISPTGLLPFTLCAIIFFWTNLDIIEVLSLISPDQLGQEGSMLRFSTFLIAVLMAFPNLCTLIELSSVLSGRLRDTTKSKNKAG